jgi:hypothetical protein
MPKCNDCGKDFEDFGELALHIRTSPKKSHKHGRKWAANYRLKAVVFGEKQMEHTGLTAEQKQSKQDSRRELSGEMTYKNTICPKCKRGGRPLLPVEYAESEQAWKIGNNIAKLCQNCGGVN